jgi:adenylosuccinate synthase
MPFLAGTLELPDRIQQKGQEPVHGSTAGRRRPMGIFQLLLIGVPLVMLWCLTKIVVAMIDLLEKLVTLAIVMAITLVLLMEVVMHAKLG